MISLARGVAALTDQSYAELVRYPGDRLITGIAIGLAVFVPLAGIVALAAQATAPSSLLGLGLVGLLVLAFVDARRAGAIAIPSAVPLPLEAQPEPVAISKRELSRYASFGGKVRRVSEGVTGPVSGQSGVAVRCDVRAGERAEILVRDIRGQDFVVESPDGTAVLVTGYVEIDAPHYTAHRDSRQVDLARDGAHLLPAEFSDGGWACELLLRGGDSVEVYGEIGSEQPHPLGADYRSTATVSVIHGSSGQPVRVRRLVGRDVEE